MSISIPILCSEHVFPLGHIQSNPYYSNTDSKSFDKENFLLIFSYGWHSSVKFANNP